MHERRPRHTASCSPDPERNGPLSPCLPKGLPQSSPGAGPSAQSAQPGSRETRLLAPMRPSTHRSSPRCCKIEVLRNGTASVACPGPSGISKTAGRAQPKADANWHMENAFRKTSILQQTGRNCRITGKVALGAPTNPPPFTQARRRHHALQLVHRGGHSNPYAPRADVHMWPQPLPFFRKSLPQKSRSRFPLRQTWTSH